MGVGGRFSWFRAEYEDHVAVLLIDFLVHVLFFISDLLLEWRSGGSTRVEDPPEVGGLRVSVLKIANFYFERESCLV